MDNPTGKLIQITDIIETKVRKEKELEFYEKSLRNSNKRCTLYKKTLTLPILLSI